MKKILLLMMATVCVLTVEAKYIFNLSDINPWGGSSGEGVTVSSGTISYTTAWKGASIWPGPDLTGYTHIYVRLASNCAFNLTAQDSSTGESIISVGASTTEHVVTFPIPGNKASFGGLSFQAREVGSIVIKEICAINMTANLDGLTYGDPGLGWPGNTETSTANTYDSTTKTITMGTNTASGHEGDWCGVQWWVAWNSSTESNSGANYYAYDKVVVRFSEATAGGGGVKVEYRNSTGDGNESTVSYTEFGDNTNQVEVVLNKTFKSRVCAVTITGPQNAVYKLESAKLVKNTTYYPFASNVTPTISATTGATVELERPLKAGWNTICLPFDTEVSTIANNAELYEFTGASNTSITLTKKDNGAMVANTPYFVKTTAAINDPIVFTNVTVSDAGAGSTSEYNGLTFKGNYTAGFSMENKYGIANGVIRPGGAGSTLKAFGAYFDGTWPASARELNIVIDDETTGISTITSSQFTTEDVYNLNGQRIQQPQKGIYIKNGKKYIAK